MEGRSDDGAAAAAARELLSERGTRDPYPAYRQLREAAPVHLLRPGIWLVSAYEPARSVLRDPRFARGFERTQSLLRPDGLERPGTELNGRTLLNLDGSHHTRVRRLVSRAFRSDTVERLESEITSVADDLLDEMERDGGGDLVSGFANPLPRLVMARLLGVPDSEAEALAADARALTATLEVEVDEDALAAADRAATTLDGAFTALVTRRRRRPANDLLSRLADLDAGETRVTTGDVTALAVLLYVAGYDNVARQVANAVVALLEEPWQVELLRHRADHCSAFPDELIRYDPAVQATTRTAISPVSLGPARIERDDAVVVLLGAVNRDPARYPEPDRIDLQRPDARPLSFGGGVHHCVGIALARALVGAAVATLFRRFPAVEDVGRARFTDRLTFRGLVSLPVRLGDEAVAPQRVTARPAARSGAPGVAEGSRATAAERRPEERPHTSDGHRGDAPSTAGTGRAAAELADRHAEPEPGEADLGARPVEGDDHAWRRAYRETVERRPPPSGEELDEVVELLGRVGLFAGCTPAELGELAATAYLITFESGEHLCEEGGSSGECWVIAEGEAVVTIDGVRVAHVHTDHVVGERGLVMNRPRAATVTATEHVIAYAISRERLVRLVAGSPRARRAMMVELRSRYGDDLADAPHDEDDAADDDD